MLKTALIGCGGISRVHVDCLRQMPDVRLISAADIIPGRARAVQEKCGVVVYSDWETMLEAEKPDVVHLCTPHYLHVPMAEKALAMGIHVLTEKPCATTLEQLARLQKAQTASTAQLGVCFQNRYNKSSLYLRQVAEEERFGPLLAARAFVTWKRGADYFNSAEWRGTWAQEGGGVMINQAIHTLDLMQYFCGGIAEINAHIFNDSLQDVIEVEDTAVLRLRFQNSVQGLFFATIAYSENAPVLLELCFEQARFRLEGDSLTVIENNKAGVLVSQEETEKTVGKRYWGSGHKALIRDFYDCITQDRPFAIDAFEGGKACEAVLKLYESAKTNALMHL